MVEVSDYYGLVHYWANKIYRGLPASALVDRDDLIQAGYLGLLKAAEKYDPDRGAAFATFANRFYIGEMKGLLRAEDWLPQERREEVQGLRRAQIALRQELGREPEEGEIAEQMGLADEAVRHLVLLGHIGIGGEEDGVEPGDSDLPDEGAEQRDRLLARNIDDCLDQLPARDRSIFVLRHIEDLTLREVALILGDPQQTLWRHQGRINQAMQACLEGKGWDATGAGVHDALG